jgi:hypothetical protein
MRHGLAFVGVSSLIGLALVEGGLACVNVVESSGDISGLSGGDALAELSPQSPPPEGVVCTAAGMSGGDCTDGGPAVCCGSATGTEVCLYADGGTTGVCTAEPALGTGSTWTELYADYFGDHGRASCAGTPSGVGCHGSVTGLGASYSKFLCPSGDAGACYASMKANLLPQYNLMTNVLRSSGCTAQGLACNMPLAPYDYAFTATDEARIAAWVDAGAPNN